MSQADFARLFELPLQKQLEPLKENSGSSRRESLDAVEPGGLYRKLAEGARSAKAAYKSHLSNETYGLIDTCLTKAKQECEQVKELWAQLDHYDRSGVWEGIKAGYGAGEANIGAAVGGLFFGGLGAVIGGALGGWVAGSRVDENFQKGMQDYGNWVLHWCEELDNELQNRILPAVQRDMERPLPFTPMTRQLPAVSQSSRNIWGSSGRVLAVLVSIAGISIGGWYLYARHQNAQKQAAVSLHNDEQNTYFAGLEGKWVSDSSRGYDAVLVGNTLEFRVHNALEFQRDGYQSGEMHFRLRRENVSDAAFTVEQKVRPILPASLRYSRESQDSCQELITAVDTQPLRAQLVDDRLSIDMAKLLATPEILDTKRGQVLNCKDLQRGRILKIQIALTRLSPGKDFPAPDKLAQTRKNALKSGSVRAALHHSPSTEGERTNTAPKPELETLDKSEHAIGIGSAE